MGNDYSELGKERINFYISVSAKIQNSQMVNYKKTLRLCAFALKFLFITDECC